MTASFKIGDKVRANGGERIGEIVSVTAGIYRVAFNHGGGVITFGEFPVDRLQKAEPDASLPDPKMTPKQNQFQSPQNRMIQPPTLPRVQPENHPETVARQGESAPDLDRAAESKPKDGDGH